MAEETDPDTWYVLRTFSNHEKKVRRYLESEIERLGFEDQVEEILIPTETVFEMKGGEKKTKEKTFFPGYILLNCTLTSELRDIAEDLPSVIGFLTAGTGDTPTQLREEEIKRVLGKMDRAEEMGEQPEMPFKVGDPVKVVDGPFDSFNGIVEDVYPDKMKVKVMVSIFGRKTPVLAEVASAPVGATFEPPL
ncbi:MAG: transcription termination/antitermination factor NusG [Bacteroidetes bacterium QH_2_64_74]|nr:MAG: transcription termination/antitermination factor NusG [Bacteroidetes bacterium QH_2_64_74]